LKLTHNIKKWFELKKNICNKNWRNIEAKEKKNFSSDFEKIQKEIKL